MNLIDYYSLLWQSINNLKMNNDLYLRDLRVLCTVARRGSFIAAAAELGTSPPYVSKRIAALEAMWGVQLFHRTTRRVAVTEDGDIAYNRARRILEEVEEMNNLLAGGEREPRGMLRISTSLRLGRLHVTPILSMLRTRHTELEIWLELLDRRVDLAAESFDLDIRVGDVQEASVIPHKIAESTRVLCASPRYVERRGAPRSMPDLVQHDCLAFRDRQQAFGVWQLNGPNGTEAVKVTGPMASNQSDIVREWALDGHGIIMASEWDVADSIESGALVRILPDHSRPADVWAVSTARSSASAKVRVAVDFLRQQLSDGPLALRRLW